MNREQMEGSLRQVAGKVKERWGVLTCDPVGAAAGRRDQLAGRIQQRRAISQQQAARQLKEFLYRNRNWHVSSR